jgi:hypothetical protein
MGETPLLTTCGECSTVSIDAVAVFSRIELRAAAASSWSWKLV